MPRQGSCIFCGGDWDEGGWDFPPYDNCTCVEKPDAPDEADVRAEREYADLDRGEL
jgi:hypothetical protein